MQVFLPDPFSTVCSLPNVLFVPCMSPCQEATSCGVPDSQARGSPKHEMEAVRPSTAFPHTQSITQGGNNYSLPAGHYPPCRVKHSHASTRSGPAPHRAATEPGGATAFLSSSMAQRMAMGRPLRARLIPEAQPRLQFLSTSQYPAHFTRRWRARGFFKLTLTSAF